ncbi:MAG: DUF1697 domain-containing protein [Methanomassiliicoccaceae archaeon]|nr:DUF1697 domain-containing protein [Methanomassiliicoccaceae archaeon]
MVRYAAFLRGINVGSTKRVSIADITAMLSSSFNDVKAYGQSGNFAFDTEMNKDDIVSLIENGIEKEFGFNAFCIIRTMDELKRTIDGYPFRGVPNEHSYIIFMNGPAHFDEDDEWNYKDDAAKLAGDVIYLMCEKYHRTNLTNNFFEKELGVICTARNLNTVNAVLRL